ncbi:MAG: hypothetical protein J0L57_08175 [Burkholderiales bacterium]|nr:hypothetical protein [Burkholderiales bacterium]
MAQAPALAAAAGVRRLRWVDADFADWPLDDEGLLQGLGRWLRLPQRELLLLGADFETVAQRRPRFMAWYRDRTHAVHAWTPLAAEDRELPTLLLIDGAAALQVFDRRHWRARWGAGAAEVQPWGHQIDALLQRCAPALAATTLGL